MSPGYTLPPVPPESDFFPVRVTAALGGTPAKYLIQECWMTSGGIIADKIGGRVNTANDPAYAIDGSSFGVTAAGSAVQVLARRAVGSGGIGWELQNLGSLPQFKEYDSPSGDTGTMGVDTFLAQNLPGVSASLGWIVASGYIQVGAGGASVNVGFNYDPAPAGVVGLSQILALVLPANTSIPFALVGLKPAVTTVNILYKILSGNVSGVAVSGINVMPGVAT